MRKNTDQKSNQSRIKRPFEDGTVAASKEDSNGVDELIFADKDKDRWMQESAFANKQLAFQLEEKEKRADELFIADKKLTLPKQVEIES
jgi:hypothetical protein